MDKNQQAYEQLKKGIENFVKQMVNNAPITKIDTAVIVSKGTKNGYKIKLNNVIYDNVLALNEASFSAKDTVKVIIPNGKIYNMFILGKLS